MAPGVPTTASSDSALLSTSVLAHLKTAYSTYWLRTRENPPGKQQAYQTPCSPPAPSTGPAVSRKARLSASSSVGPRMNSVKRGLRCEKRGVPNTGVAPEAVKRSAGIIRVKHNGRLRCTDTCVVRREQPLHVLECGEEDGECLTS